ncbi:exported protein of unknown function [Nitrospira japonica]|uniref:Uncharacterized protein n=1 Tax=Nitrospira japonica TaxID=1325564 RepID=A0A1W1I4F6_9BACT|nr:hypothetical protein [Nitrospira japonica]SLM47821.1 exported protein of unknown function [Nitrospira japonica]
MKPMRRQRQLKAAAYAALLAVMVISLANCSSSDSSTPAASTSSGSAALQGPLVFVNNTGDKTLTSVSLKGDAGNAVAGTIDAAKFGNVALGDMQFSEGEWLFVNLGAGNAVALVDPLTGATPIHETNLTTGTRPVHIYRDPNDGEVIWSMNDGDNAGGTATPGDDLINCAAQSGGSVTVIHNSHLGPGANIPHILGTICLLADGHKVTAFSSGAGIPRRAFVSSEVGGEVAVIDNDETSANYLKVTARIDLCNSTKEAVPCNDESATPLTTAFTPNNSHPHGIRWSQLTKKVYSIQEGYDQIAEIDPTTLAITNTFDLTGTPYTGYGISADGRFLLLRGDTTPATGTKLGILDLSVTPAVRTDFTIPELDGTAPGSFKFSPDGKRFYILAGNTATATKKDRLFAFDSSTLTATPPALTLLKEIPLVATGGHSLDLLIQGAGAATYVVVSNSTDNSVSVINATDNTIKQTVQVGPTPGAVMVYYPGAAAAGNQATASVVSGVQAAPMLLPERLDDYGMR